MPPPLPCRPLCRPLLLGLLASVALPRLPPSRAQSFFDACDAQYENVDDVVGLVNGEAALREIGRNFTHRYTYSNYNLTTMQQNDTERKLIISLEPCYGIVYLFVRKNIPCHPDPYSCINLDTGLRDARICTRTHFMSVIDGSRDGAPTLFQISLSATKYYISVYAVEDSRYTLTMLDEVGAWPLRGNDGIVSAQVVDTSKVMLQWHAAYYFPLGVAETLRYYVYFVRLMPNDTITNPAVFLRPSKILNTYCGLQNNTDQHDDSLPSELCDETCNTTLEGLLSESTYAFNIVVESTRGFRMTYSGVTLQTTWAKNEAVEVPATRRLLEASSVPMDNKDMQVVGAVMGSVLGMVGMAGLVLLRFMS